MTVTETRQLPPQFIETLGTDLATQLVAQTGRPTVAPGAGGISQLAGESAADFAKRQQAAQQFDIRKQSIAGLAPTIAGQDALQQQAQQLAQTQAGASGLASFAPFLQGAQTQAGLASGRNLGSWRNRNSTNRISRNPNRCNDSCTDTTIYVPISITSD